MVSLISNLQEDTRFLMTISVKSIFTFKLVLNHFQVSDTLTLLKLEKLASLFHGNCYKVTPTTSKQNGVWILMETYFDASISKEILPSVEIFQSSEENANGVIIDSWEDGKVFALYAEKIQIFSQ